LLSKLEAKPAVMLPVKKLAAAVNWELVVQRIQQVIS